MLGEAEAQRHKLPPTYVQVPFDAKSWARQQRVSKAGGQKLEGILKKVFLCSLCTNLKIVGGCIISIFNSPVNL